MSLEQLQQLERDARDIESSKSRLDGAEKALADLRNGGRTLVEIVVITRDWKYSSEEAAKIALHEVINECKLDLLRLAELRLAAKSRELKIQAAQRRAVIAASILPIPEIKQ